MHGVTLQVGQRWQLDLEQDPWSTEAHYVWVHELRAGWVRVSGSKVDDLTRLQERRPVSEFVRLYVYAPE